MTRSIVATLAVLILLTAPALALQPTTTPVLRVGVDPCGIIGNGDLVEVTIFGVVGPNAASVFPIRVDGNGKVALPFVGPIAIAGKSPDVAAEVVSAAFGRAQVITGAIVTISRLESGDDPSVPPGDYAVGDGVRLIIYELTGPGEPLVIYGRIAENGTVTLPFAGTVTLRGLDDNDAAKAVINLLRNKQIAQNAIVSVLKISSAGAAPAEPK